MRTLPRVHLDMPTDWRMEWETNDGATVQVWRPGAALPGTLRILTDRIPADGPDAAAVSIKMRETALRFVRPDDNRVGDRIIESRHPDDGEGDGGIIASAVIAATTEDGTPETHYLWMIADPADGAVSTAMAALAVPGAVDGTEAAAAVVELVDGLIRAARLNLE